MRKLSPTTIGVTLLFFISAVIMVVVVQLVRQSKPEEIQSGWRYQVAVTLDRGGDLFHALEELEKGLSEPESREDSQKLLQAIAIRRKKAPQTLVEINDAIGDDGLKFKRGKLYFAKGVVLELLGRDKEAIQAFETSIELKERQSISLVRLGLAYERIGDLIKAEEYFDQALKKGDPALLTHFHYGLFLLRAKNDPEKAQQMAKFVEQPRPLYAKIIRDRIQPN